MPCDINRTFFCFFFPPPWACGTGSNSGLPLLVDVPDAPPHLEASGSAPTGLDRAAFILARRSASALELGKLGNSARLTTFGAVRSIARPGVLVGWGRAATGVGAGSGAEPGPDDAHGVERAAVDRGVRPTTGRAGKRGAATGGESAARSTRAQMAGSRAPRLFSARCVLCAAVGTPLRVGPSGARDGN